MDIAATLLSGLLLAATPPFGAELVDAGPFLRRHVEVDDRRFPVGIFLPVGWTRDRAWPVVLYLHGAGERGDDFRHLRYGLAKALWDDPARLPAIVVMPQAPIDERWIGAPADAALTALDEAVAEFHGDPGRVALTGLSLGGYGVWHLALLAPGRFAALAPVCGGVVPAGAATSVRRSPLTEAADDPHAFVADRLARLPVWLFHGAKDTTVLPSESRTMAALLRERGGNVRYTEYPDVGHGAWTPAYADPELHVWLVAHRRGDGTSDR